MGTWGTDSFANDEAVEWAAAFRETGLPVAESTIKIALEDHLNNRLSAGIASRGIAAVEAVAHVLGRGSAEAARLFEGAPVGDPAMAATLVDEANDLIAGIADGSSLAQLWKAAEGGGYEDWLATLADLQSRVTGAAEADVAAETGAVVPSEVPIPDATALEDLRKAIGDLEYDIEVLRQEMSDNFARLARRLEGIVK
ncbi:MAG: DUF4259 domain-containing protein [Pseudomonadota bacterium]